LKWIFKKGWKFGVNKKWWYRKKIKKKTNRQEEN
jgi:hypothetical protein